MAETKTPITVGPERLTILERVIELTRLPYLFGCLLLSVLCGGPGVFVIFYLGSFNLEEAWRRTVSTASFSFSPVNPQVPVAQGVVDVTFYTVALFVFMEAVRYWRLKVVSSEPPLYPLAPGGETAFHRAFGLVCSAKGSLSLFVFLSILYLPSRLLSAGGPFYVLGTAIVGLFDALVFATLLWVYFSGLWGLHRFGLQPLNLKPFYEDEMLGLRPLGHLAVSFASVFFVVVTIQLLGGLLWGDVYTQALTLGFLAIGLVLLFLPLVGIRREMIRVREEEARSLRMKRNGVLFKGKSPGNESQQSISNIEELLKLQALEAEVSRIPSWPFETRTVERLVAVILTIFTAILTKLLTGAL